MRRLLNAVVLLFAGYAFFFVPVGRKTGAQHAIAIFTTPPAREAASALATAARLLVARVAAEVKHAGQDRPDPSGQRPPGG